MIKQESSDAGISDEHEKDYERKRNHCKNQRNKERSKKRELRGHHALDH